MAEQAELDCVSCETAFDPTPNGGFCPNCDTPHPDYEAPTGGADSGGNDAEAVEEVTDGGDAVAKVEDAEDDAEADDAQTDEVGDAEDDAEADEVEDAEDRPETESDDEDETDLEGEADDEESDTDADDAEDEADEEPATVECQSCDSEVDASAAFCPHCGTELEDEDEDETVELEACPDCGNSIDDESFCPNCGTDLDAIREGGAVDDADADSSDDDAGDDEADDGDAAEDDADEVPEEVVLEVDGEPYTFGDGDVFGRRDEEWLADLVSASGGREEARYLSSDHLEFSIEDDGVYVTDVSTNGTKLNGTAMDGSEEKLEDGDTLELADRAEIDVKLE